MENLRNNKSNDAELLAQVKKGSKSAFAMIYKQYKTKVYWKIKSKINDAAIAEELMQDVFIKVWEKRADLDPEKSFIAYLFCIANSRIIDFCRKEKRDQQVMGNLQRIGTEVFEEPMESDLSKNEGELLIQAIEKLSPQRKRIFILCKLDGKSYEEVSKMLGHKTTQTTQRYAKVKRQKISKTLARVKGIVFTEDGQLKKVAG